MKRPTKLQRVIGQLLPDGAGEEAHRARVLMVAGLVFIAAGLLISAAQVILWVHPAFPPAPAIDLAVDPLVLLLGGLVVWLVRSERVRAASWVVISSLLVVAIAHLYLEGRPADIAGGLGLFLVVTLAFVLLDRRGARLVAAVSAASFVGMHVLWLRSHLPRPRYRDPSSQVLFSVLAWLATAGIVAAVVSSTIAALRRHREHLEEMVAERTVQLRRSEEKMRAQYKGIPIPTYTWQWVEDGFLLADYNDAAEAITAGGIADLVGERLDDVHHDTPQIREDIERCYTERATIERERSYRYVSTGEKKHLAVKYAFVPPDLVIVHTEDITERKEMEEQLMRQERLAVLGQLAGGVGHELRNPLGAIKNATYFLNMVLGEQEPEPAVEETLEIMDQELARSERIISALLDFARARPPVWRQVDLNDVVRAALSRAAVREAPGVELVCELDRELPVIMGDPDQLERVLGNMIRNAVQAMPEGGRLTVRTFETSEVTGRLPKSGVMVSIADTGVGIPEENLERIFEPLFTTRTKGIGLGLALAKRLVEEHSGSIEVESEVGEGSTFIVWLPGTAEVGGRGAREQGGEGVKG